MKKRQKRAFTLTELLVTVVIIGVLAAVVLPKFNKVMEGMKTGEAERMLTAVRTEQEARCTLGQDYLADGAKVRAFPGNNSKNYTYAFTPMGMTAQSKSGTYTLKMPSYMDGRICCEGTGCAGLNKDYPTCEALTALTNYQPGTACAAVPVVPPPPPGCGEKPAQPADKPCGCNNTGHQSYTWNEETCEWELGTTCEGEDASGCAQRTACSTPWTEQEKATCACDTKDADKQPCTNGEEGQETRTVTCNQETGKWEYGNWDTSACVCKPTHNGQTSYYGEWCPQIGSSFQAQIGSGLDSYKYRIHYTWNPDTCQYDPEDECDTASAGVEDKEKQYPAWYVAETSSVSNKPTYANQGTYLHACFVAKKEVCMLGEYGAKLCEDLHISEGTPCEYSGVLQECLVSCEASCKGNIGPQGCAQLGAGSNNFFCDVTMTKLVCRSSAPWHDGGRLQVGCR